jgi:nitrogen fixation NifU-like protein
MFDELNELYQKVILDHNKAPRNFRQLPEANRSGEGHNPLCGDRFIVFARVENDVIADISFQGSGCAISKAAASLMTEILKGKPVAEARQVFTNFQAMLKTGKTGGEELGDLRVFAVVQRFPMRVKCATLPWQALEACLGNDEGLLQ